MLVKNYVPVFQHDNFQVITFNRAMVMGVLLCHSNIRLY